MNCDELKLLQFLVAVFQLMRPSSAPSMRKGAAGIGLNPIKPRLC